MWKPQNRNAVSFKVSTLKQLVLVHLHINPINPSNHSFVINILSFLFHGKLLLDKYIKSTVEHLYREVLVKKTFKFFFFGSIFSLYFVFSLYDNTLGHVHTCSIGKKFQKCKSI